MDYAPPQEILERYARLLIDYALGHDEGIQPGDVVRVIAAESAKPLFVELCRAVWRSGGNVLADYQPSDDEHHHVGRDFYEIASDAQLDFFAESYARGLLEQTDHLVNAYSMHDPHALGGVEPAKLLRARRAQLPALQWRLAKEAAGNFTWTLGLYGTPGMAAEAGMTVEEYWEQIIKACFLDHDDPIARWREVNAQIAAHCERLNGLGIDRVHVEGPDADLWITIGERRRWIGGSGRNIPSFEIFTSPDWRGTEGWIRFSEPLYLHGSLITGIELHFEAGRVVRATAAENEALLTEIIATEGSDRVGEFSMTDSRLSPIDRFMANTLFDENTGGRYGNTHLALGFAIPDTFDGAGGGSITEDGERLGFNQSAVHTDIVSTTDRTVTALLGDGSERVIYADGRFTD